MAAKLTIAQILADLDSLLVTDRDASYALLDAHQTVTSCRYFRRRSRHLSLPSKPDFKGGASLGRRVQEPSASNSNSPFVSPGISRTTSSAIVDDEASSGPGRKESEATNETRTASGVSFEGLSGAAIEDEDVDMRRAKDLTELWSRRAEFKTMGEVGLGRAKEKIDEIVRRYEEMDAQREK